LASLFLAGLEGVLGVCHPGVLVEVVEHRADLPAGEGRIGLANPLLELRVHRAQRNLGRMNEARGAAFFDLDKTLIEGSSALHFGRAAHRAGLMSRRQLASDAWANVKY